MTAYFREVPFETAAPFIDDASQYLDKVTDFVRAFVRALRIPAEEAAMEAALRVRELIEIAAPSLDIAHLEGLTQGFALACDAVRRDLEQQAPQTDIEEGQAWNELIRVLTEFSKELGLPTGASKGFAKSKSGRSSPFVAFVSELQKSFPNRYRRHNQSHQALAKAIGDARRSGSVSLRLS